MGQRTLSVAFAVALLLLPPALATLSGEWTVEYPYLVTKPTPVTISTADDGSHVLVAGRESGGQSFLHLFDAVRGTLVDSRPRVGENYADFPLAVSAGAATIVIADQSYRVIRGFHDASLATPAWAYPLSGQDIRLDVTPDGRFVAAAAQSIADGLLEVVVLDRNGTLVFSHLQSLFPGELRTVAISDDGLRVFVSTGQASYVLGPAAKILGVAIHRHCCVDMQAAFSPKGDAFVLGDQAGLGLIHTYRYDGTANAFLPAWDQPSGRNSVRELAFSGDGTRLVVGANDRGSGVLVTFNQGLVKTFDAVTGEALWQSAGFGSEAKIDSVSVSSDGSRVAVGAYGSISGGERGPITVYGADGSVIASIDPPNLGSAFDARLSADGSRVVAFGVRGHPVTGMTDRIIVGATVTP